MKHCLYANPKHYTNCAAHSVLGVFVTHFSKKTVTTSGDNSWLIKIYVATRYVDTIKKKKKDPQLNEYLAGSAQWLTDAIFAQLHLQLRIVTEKLLERGRQ